jgi:hypothetical protein
MTYRTTLLMIVLFPLAGCMSSQTEEIMAGADQVELRSYQTRAFDTTDRTVILRGVIATLQDLAFVIDEADETLGIVSGTRLTYEPVRISVVVRARNDSQLLVRASAYKGLQPIEDAEPYQDFFTSLEKSLFLTAHDVD